MPCCAVATSYGPPGGRYKRGGGGGHGEGCRATSSACGLRGAVFDSPLLPRVAVAPQGRAPARRWPHTWRPPIGRQALESRPLSQGQLALFAATLASSLSSIPHDRAGFSQCCLQLGLKLTFLKEKNSFQKKRKKMLTRILSLFLFICCIRFVLTQT